MLREDSGASGNGGDPDDFSFENENNSEDPINRLVNRLVLDRIRENPFDMDEGVAGKIIALVPIGLRLPKTPQLVNSAEMAVMQGRSSSGHESSRGSAASSVGQRTENLNHDKEKLKASNFPASFLRIGDWKVVPENQGDLVAKCYFAKQKLVWEILDTQQKLKRKIEVQWSDISALKATFDEDEPGMLEIELERPPTFFQEQDPQPRKHTIWNSTTDFTQGQALAHRRHCLIFPKGTLEKPYLKLLQADGRLWQLSRQPFPSSPYPLFIRDPYSGSIIPSSMPMPMPMLPSQPLHQQENITHMGNWNQARYINTNQDYACPGFSNQMVAMLSHNLYSNLQSPMYQNNQIERVNSLDSWTNQNVENNGSIWRGTLEQGNLPPRSNNRWNNEAL